MRAIALTLLTLSSLVACVSAEPVTYHVGPITLKYAGFYNNADVVVQGTITTNGTTGERSIEPDDIIDYSITVDGPLPYTFRPSNPFASVSPAFVSASSSMLTTSGHFGRIYFDAKENSFPTCSVCRQELGFRSWPFPLVTYHTADSDGDPPYAEANWYSEPGSIALLIGRNSAHPLLPGDYNDDRTVDAADYVVWRKNLSMSVELLNDTTFGYVNAADYTVWAARFGESTLEGAVLPVPEASSGLLAWMCISMFSRARLSFPLRGGDRSGALPLAMAP